MILRDLRLDETQIKELLYPPLYEIGDWGQGLGPLEMASAFLIRVLLDCKRGRECINVGGSLGVTTAELVVGFPKGLTPPTVV